MEKFPLPENRPVESKNEDREHLLQDSRSILADAEKKMSTAVSEEEKREVVKSVEEAYKNFHKYFPAQEAPRVTAEEAERADVENWFVAFLGKHSSSLVELQG